MFVAKLVIALSVVYSIDALCAPGDQIIGDLCYWIPNEKLPFADAQHYCRQAGENLAVVHSTFQANFLASTVRSKTGAPEGKFWIGLSRQSVSSRFQWDDGTAMYWSNFDMNYAKDNLYVAESTLNGKWQTLSGDQPLFFVCSSDPNAKPVSTRGYPVSGATGNPASPTPVYPVSGATGYPVSGQPASQTPGYPVSGATGYPVSGQPASQTPGYPVSGATGYPASRQPYTNGYPVSGATGNPASQTPGYPVSGATGYPPSGRPYTNGYPVSSAPKA